MNNKRTLIQFVSLILDFLNKIHELNIVQGVFKTILKRECGEKPQQPPLL